ncbi:hypothetical protein QQZ08_001836 [Neonectria magnoliae]|uniref:Uncharacterized protein n=1 Tax=Neonectria magnoliae TaxID=2732573 RepID=A0ABR1IDH9_9HYPO
MELFLSTHLSWEDEQVGYAHDFLEKKFSKATFDVLSQDIFFGHSNLDYLSLGTDNQRKKL